MFKNISVYGFLFLLVAASNSFGAWYVWTNGNGNQEWNSSGNWSPSGVPGQGDFVQADMADGNMPILDSADNVMLEQLNLGTYAGSGGIGEMRMTGGVLAFGGSQWFDITLGYFLGRKGTLYMDGGTIDCIKRIAVGGEEAQPGGVGRIIMTGGSIKTRWIWDSGLRIFEDSYIDLSGGTIECESIMMDMGPSDINDGYINITGGGRLILRDKIVTTDVNALIAANLIRGDFTVTTSGTKIIITGNNPQCGSWGYYPMDFNRDCYVDFMDFADFALNWLACTDPDGQGCVELLP